MHWIADALHVKSLERGCRLHSKAQPTCEVHMHGMHSLADSVLTQLPPQCRAGGEGDMCWHTACTRSPTGSMRRAQSAGSNQ